MSEQILSTTPEDAVTEFTIDRLTNFHNSRDGRILPPRQRGSGLVPCVQGLQIVKIIPNATSTTFALSWQDIAFDATIGVDHYNIYYTIVGTSTEKIGPFSAHKSPAQVTIAATGSQIVTFYLQVVLANGQTTSLDSSPTVSAQLSVIPGVFNITGLTLTDNSPGAGNVAWTACTVYYSGTPYPITSGNTTSGHKYIYWTVGGTTFTESDSYTPATNVFLVATNISGTSDTAWNKVGAGAVIDRNLNLPTVLVGPNGALLVNGFTFTDNSPGAGKVAWSTGTITYRGISYAIGASDTGGAGVWIYWALASPTGLQSSTTFPVLGTDDFLVGFNNSGAFAPTIEIHRNERLYYFPGGIVSDSSAGKPCFSLTKASGGASGVCRLYDGTGTGSLGSGQKIIATGSDGKIQLYNLDINEPTLYGGSNDLVTILNSIDARLTGGGL